MSIITILLTCCFGSLPDRTQRYDLMEMAEDSGVIATGLSGPASVALIHRFGLSPSMATRLVAPARRSAGRSLSTSNPAGCRPSAVAL